VPALSSSALVLAWEQGLQLPALERPLALLTLVGGPEDAAGLSIGRRDAELLALREETFGNRVESVVDCAACGEALELSFDTAELERGSDALPESHVLVVGGAEVRFRLPTNGDLIAVSAFDHVDAARERLLERCVLTPPAVELNEAAQQSVVERMAELDPLATVELELLCPACGAAAPAAFDIASFVWAELDAAARSALEDVHALASAYGWSEEDVLALSPARRRVYLEFVG
jgi:hypothetical protein